MFVQVIQGRTTDPAGVRGAMDRWVQDLSAGAAGWLGSTAGVAVDSRFIALMRFESEAAARRNSNRPAQRAWCAEAFKLFDGEVTIHDGSRAAVELIGEPDQAGFLQVIQGRASDPDRALQLWLADREIRVAHCPEFLGKVAVEYDDGAYTMVIYYTTEQEFRAGLRKEMPPELQTRMAQMHALNVVGAATFLDLDEPWLYSAR